MAESYPLLSFPFVSGIVDGGSIGETVGRSGGWFILPGMKIDPSEIIRNQEETSRTLLFQTSHVS
jgi:hypothetical protein